MRRHPTLRRRNLSVYWQLYSSRCVQASIYGFFARPDAPRVRHLRVDAGLGAAWEMDSESVLAEIWRFPPSLDWLTPALRSARSLRLTFDIALMHADLNDSKKRLQARTTAALLSVCGALETLHLESEKISILDAHSLRKVLPAGALPASVRHLILQSKSQICLPPKGSRLDAPEFRQLQHLELRSSRLFLQSLSVFEDHQPQQLTLQAGSFIRLFGRSVGDVVQVAQELSASGRCLELCCPSQDCIGIDWPQSTRLDLEVPKQQAVQLVEEFRAWFVGNAITDGG